LENSFPSACLVVHQPHTATTHLAHPDKYPMNENMELHEWPRYIQEHLDAFFAGRLRPHIKSQDPPRHNQVGPVYDVVGTTFDQMVTHNTKDVIVMFYAPWGQHSDFLKPVYEELAAQLEPVQNLQFLRFDATENDWPRNEYPVHGYPALYFRKASKGKPIAYHGNLTHDLIYTFIRHHSSGTHEQFKQASSFDETARAILEHVDQKGIWSVFRSESADFSARIHRILREFRRRHRALIKQAAHYSFYHKSGKDGLSAHDHPLHLADLHDHLDHEATEEDEQKHLEEHPDELDHDHANGDEGMIFFFFFFFFFFYIL
jgi:thiol-disulfide isomerase/thioredoxin